VTNLAPLPTPATSENTFRRAARLLLLVSLPLYVLDQVTKWLVVRDIAEWVPVIPGWFDLVNVTNTGAAFGILKDSNRGFLLLSVAALIVLAVLYWQGAFERPLARVGFFLLIPGILGNLTDRLLRGHVVDFLSFDLHVPGAHPWPSFNVADSCICLAVAGFLIGSWQDLRRPEPGR
jgi:signal peptidase II